MAKKLHCPWSGPFTIIKKLSSVVYRIQDTRKARKNRKVVHFDRLKPCAENTRLDDSKATPIKCLVLVEYLNSSKVMRAGGLL